MSLFGEKCARCGKRRTKEEYEGVPTCESCRVLMQKQVEASTEARQSCPIDGTPMSKEIVLSVIVDRCPKCRGVWLDGGELELLEAAIEAGAAAEVVRGLVGVPV